MPDSPKLTALSGEISAQLFENPRMGVPRAVYWSCNIEFAPIHDTSAATAGANQGWACTLLCDWITWPVRDWRQIDGLTLANCVGPMEVEASLYLFNVHQPLTSIELAFRRTVASKFRWRGRIVGDLEDLEGRALRDVSANFEVDAEFTGLAVVPENLNPKPKSEERATQALASHADLTAYEQPLRDKVGWLFRPRT